MIPDFLILRSLKCQPMSISVASAAISLKLFKKSPKNPSKIATNATHRLLSASLAQACHPNFKALDSIAPTTAPSLKTQPREAVINLRAAAAIEQQIRFNQPPARPPNALGVGRHLFAGTHSPTGGCICDHYWSSRTYIQVINKFGKKCEEWSVTESNRWPQQCHCCALPAELTPQKKEAKSINWQ